MCWAPIRAETSVWSEENNGKNYDNDNGSKITNVDNNNQINNNSMLQ